MPVKSSKSAVSSKSTQVNGKLSKSRVVSSKSSSGAAQQSRNRFVAGAVLVAAALVAITAGLLTYGKYDATRQDNSATQTVSGSMFLQAIDDTNLTPGSTVKVTLLENSGKDPINAVQGAVTYPAEKLEVVSVTTGQSFPQEAATDTASKGLIRVARSIKPDSPVIRGVKPIAVLEFKVRDGAKPPFELNVDENTSLLVRSTDNQNILKPSGNSALLLGE